MKIIVALALVAFCIFTFFFNTMTIFIIGSFWFWTLVIATICVMIYTEEMDDSNAGVYSVLELALFFGILYWFGAKEFVVNIFSYILHNPFQTLGWILAYAICGVIYGTYRWYDYCIELKNRHIKYQTYDLTSKGIIALTPQILDNKSRFMRWMWFWPVLGIWTLLHDPLQKLYTAIFNFVSSYLQKIADKIFSSIPAK